MLSLFRENSKNSALFLAKTITARRSIEWSSIDYCKNISTSKLTVKTGLKNIPFVLWKIRKLKFLSLMTGRKFGIDREPVVVFIQKSDESDQ